MILANMLAQAGDVVNSTSPAVWIFAGFSVLANLSFWLRWEHRMTKVEEAIKHLGKTGCDACKVPIRHRHHPGLHLAGEEETA